MIRKFSRIISLVSSAVFFVVVLALSACTQEVPLATEANYLSNETLDQQRQFVRQQADAAVETSGIVDGWYERGNSPEAALPWRSDEERDRIVRGLSSRKCAGAKSGNLDLGLNNDIVLDDPFEVASRVQEFWISEGWAISNVLEPSSKEVYFRADKPDGVSLAFDATHRGLLLVITSSCSVNSTVANRYGPAGAANEFEEELAARKQAAE